MNKLPTEVVVLIYDYEGTQHTLYLDCIKEINHIITMWHAITSCLEKVILPPKLQLKLTIHRTFYYFMMDYLRSQ